MLLQPLRGRIVRSRKESPVLTVILTAPCLLLRRLAVARLPVPEGLRAGAGPAPGPLARGRVAVAPLAPLGPAAVDAGPAVGRRLGDEDGGVLEPAHGQLLLPQGPAVGVGIVLVDGLLT